MQTINLKELTDEQLKVHLCDWYRDANKYQQALMQCQQQINAFEAELTARENQPSKKEETEPPQRVSNPSIIYG